VSRSTEPLSVELITTDENSTYLTLKFKVAVWPTSHNDNGTNEYGAVKIRGGKKKK
jgi:hypothetical protein